MTEECEVCQRYEDTKQAVPFLSGYPGILKMLDRNQKKHMKAKHRKEVSEDEKTVEIR